MTNKLKEIKKAYDNSSDFYNLRYKEIQFKKYNFALTNIKLDGKILDLGAGTGLLSKYIHNDIISLDVSINMLNKFKGKRIQADMSNIPIKKETFDYILSFSALMNSDNVERTLNEIKRILKKDGKIIISYLKKFDFLELIKNNFKILKQETIDEDVLFILEQKV